MAATCQFICQQSRYQSSYRFTYHPLFNSSLATSNRSACRFIQTSPTPEKLAMKLQYRHDGPLALDDLVDHQERSSFPSIRGSSECALIASTSTRHVLRIVFFGFLALMIVNFTSVVRRRAIEANSPLIVDTNTVWPRLSPLNSPVDWASRQQIVQSLRSCGINSSRCFLQYSTTYPRARRNTFSFPCPERLDHDSILPQHDHTVKRQHSNCAQLSASTDARLFSACRQCPLAGSTLPGCANR